MHIFCAASFASHARIRYYYLRVVQHSIDWLLVGTGGGLWHWPSCFCMRVCVRAARSVWFRFEVRMPFQARVDACGIHICQSRNASRPVKVSPCLIFSSFIFLFEVQAKTLSIWSCFDHFGQPLRHLRFARCFVLGVVEQQCQDKGMNAMNSMQNGRKQQNQRYSDNLGSNRAYPGSRRIQGELHFRAAQMFAK